MRSPWRSDAPPSTASTARRGAARRARALARRGACGFAQGLDPADLGALRSTHLVYVEVRLALQPPVRVDAEVAAEPHGDFRRDAVPTFADRVHAGCSDTARARYRVRVEAVGLDEIADQ